MAEQFDSETFNRGWNFNGALAVASGLTTASPDIKDIGIDFDCAVIQETWRERGLSWCSVLDSWKCQGRINKPPQGRQSLVTFTTHPQLKKKQILGAWMIKQG